MRLPEAWPAPPRAQTSRLWRPAILPARPRATTSPVGKLIWQGMLATHESVADVDSACMWHDLNMISRHFVEDNPLVLFSQEFSFAFWIFCFSFGFLFWILCFVFLDLFCFVIFGCVYVCGARGAGIGRTTPSPLLWIRTSACQCSRRS